MIKKNDIIAVVLILVFGSLSVYYAFARVGDSAGRMTLAAFGIMLYLVIRDFINRRKSMKEEEKKRSGGREVISISNAKENRTDIGNIAKKSTKDKALKASRESAENPPEEIPSEELTSEGAEDI